MFTKSPNEEDIYTAIAGELSAALSINGTNSSEEYRKTFFSITLKYADQGFRLDPNKIAKHLGIGERELSRKLGVGENEDSITRLFGKIVWLPEPDRKNIHQILVNNLIAHAQYLGGDGFSVSERFDDGMALTTVTLGGIGDLKKNSVSLLKGHRRDNELFIYDYLVCDKDYELIDKFEESTINNARTLYVEAKDFFVYPAIEPNGQVHTLQLKRLDTIQ